MNCRSDGSFLQSIYVWPWQPPGYISQKEIEKMNIAMTPLCYTATLFDRVSSKRDEVLLAEVSRQSFPRPIPTADRNPKPETSYKYLPQLKYKVRAVVKQASLRMVCLLLETIRVY